MLGAIGAAAFQRRVTPGNKITSPAGTSAPRTAGLPSGPFFRLIQTQVCWGRDARGSVKTRLALPYNGGNTIYGSRMFLASSPGDFVYLGETDRPFSEGLRGHPNWLVTDTYYRVGER